MSMPQCMGGWCRQRNNCRNYTAPLQHGVEPVERLCPKGQDEPEPIRVDRVREEVPA